MKKDPAFDEYKKLLEQEAFPLPEKLTESCVVEMLENAKPQQEKKKIKLFPRIVAAAAAAAIAITAVQMIPWQKTIHTTTVEPTTSQSETPKPLKLSKAAAPLSQFDSRDDLDTYFKNIAARREADSRIDGMFGALRKKSADGFAAESVADSAAVTNGALTAYATEKDFFAANGNYGKTNTRSADVDEGDVIKNDGRYLYTASGGKFSIIDTQTMQCVFQGEPEPEKENQMYAFSSLYVQGDRLVVSGTLYDGQNPIDDVYYGVRDYAFPYYDVMASATVTLVYDIADRSRPALLRAAVQDGGMESSRMVGDVLYTVTTYYANENKKSTYVPSVNGKEIPCDCIYVKDPKGDATGYIVLTALDTAQPKKEIETLSLLGGSDCIYCTADTLYVLRHQCLEEDALAYATEIYAFSLQGTDLALQSSGTVPGIVEDQYAIDRFGDYLRVTSTDYDYQTDVDISSLYVLNKKLEIVGALKDFAPDEQVKSTRFLGKTAYVVTFRNTDPLFAIDLSDPAKPSILGKVKLPGFSEYLHPISDTLLLGVGYDGDEQNANYDCIKLSLFDISDPKNPKETDTHIIKQAQSDVHFDPRAFVFDSVRSVFGLPVSYSILDSNRNWRGTNYVYKTFAVKNGAFADEKAYLRGSVDGYHYDTFFRGTYIGERVYTLTESAVQEFDMESCKKIRTLIYDEDSAEESEAALADDLSEDQVLEKAKKPPVTIPYNAESKVAPVLIDDTTTTQPTTQAP
ncbi:MAG: beta-propeller domain-containing protein [Clostridia bacterium]|nr:beta-propeller domain-containing protein [Clostridia bacterium]